MPHDVRGREEIVEPDGSAVTTGRRTKRSNTRPTTVDDEALRATRRSGPSKRSRTSRSCSRGKCIVGVGRSRATALDHHRRDRGRAALSVFAPFLHYEDRRSTRTGTPPDKSLRLPVVAPVQGARRGSLEFFAAQRWLFTRTLLVEASRRTPPGARATRTRRREGGPSTTAPRRRGKGFRFAKRSSWVMSATGIATPAAPTRRCVRLFFAKKIGYAGDASDTPVRANTTPAERLFAHAGIALSAAHCGSSG